MRRVYEAGSYVCGALGVALLSFALILIPNTVSGQTIIAQIPVLGSLVAGIPFIGVYVCDKCEGDCKFLAYWDPENCYQGTCRVCPCDCQEAIIIYTDPWIPDPVQPGIGDVLYGSYYREECRCGPKKEIPTWRPPALPVGPR